MTKSTEERADEALAAATPAIDPAQTGINHLRSLDETAPRLWTVKGPKDLPSTISAVLMQESGETVILHQFPGGKFKLFSPRAA